jgi:hypothetical protein
MQQPQLEVSVGMLGLNPYRNSSPHAASAAAAALAATPRQAAGGAATAPA